MNKQAIKRALKPLVGIPIRCIGRAANMLWIQFGEMHEVPCRRSGTRTIGDWALHVSCVWRITKAGKIVVAYHDFHYSENGTEPYDWDNEASKRSLFDVLAKKLNRQFRSGCVAVTSFKQDSVGGFCLQLESQFSLEVFPDSCKGEYWRLFQPTKEGRHFVV